MLNKFVIVCDLEGSPTGEYLEKETAHQGKGAHHLAITVLIYNQKGEVLLQKRKHKRFDGLWDLTGATDLYHLEDHDESFEEATLRCLEREYQIKQADLINLGSFNYFAEDKNMAENELCALLIGQYDGDINTHSDVAYGVKWQNKDQFLIEITENPEEFTPWAIESIKLLKKNKFFDR